MKPNLYLVEDALDNDLPVACLHGHDTARWLGVTLESLYTAISRQRLVRRRYRIIPIREEEER